MSELAEQIQAARRRLEGLLGVPATESNRVDVLRNGDEIFPAMLDAIRQSTDTVDLLTFVYWTGAIAREMADALTDRARAGVRVRVLLDAFGARSMNRDLVEEMEDAGARVEFFRPPTTWEKLMESGHRVHRKVLICDEQVAFTGGVGIAEEWEGDARDPSEWRDSHVRVRGPAVDGLRAAFVDSWAETGRPVFDDQDRFPNQPAAGDSVVQVVRGEGPVGWSAIMLLKRVLVSSARERLRITSAYFSPDETMQRLLIDALDRGVEVDVLVPGRHADKRVAQVAGEAQYDELLDAGARIWNYQRTMLHAKVLTVDGVLANVGSSNFNSRSFEQDQEVDLVVFDPDVARILDDHFESDLEDSERIEPGRWEHRSVAQRAVEGVTSIVDDHI